MSFIISFGTLSFPIGPRCCSVYNTVWLKMHKNDKSIQYDTRCYFNMCLKADISRFNLPHRLQEPKTKTWQKTTTTTPFNGSLSGTTRVGRLPAGTRRNIHSLTPILVNVLPLSPFSICNGPWHPLYSAYVLDSPLEQPLSRSWKKWQKSKTKK